MGVSESAIVEERLYVGYESAGVSTSAPDAGLVARLKRGERAAFEELIET